MLDLFFPLKYKKLLNNSYFLKKFNYFIFLFLAALGLHCFVRASSSCGAWPSHCGGFFCCGAWALGAPASLAVAHRLNSCGSWALERGISSCGART